VPNSNENKEFSEPISVPIVFKLLQLSSVMVEKEAAISITLSWY
jgi:hypothetical protein